MEANLIISILSFLSNIFPIWTFFHPRRKREFPFKAIAPEQLKERLSSPLKWLPDYINRISTPNIDSKLKIYFGSRGVGKTREAFEYYKQTVKTLGVEHVYYATGYIRATNILPAGSPVKKVFIFIDDYDHGNLLSASSDDYYERASAVEQSISNLLNIYKFFNRRTELCGCVVVINEDRIPIHRAINECRDKNFELIEVPQVDPETYVQFFSQVANKLHKSFTPEIKESFKQICDGRFSSLSIFLSNYINPTIDNEALKNFGENLDQVWKLYRNNLSNTQKKIYDAVAILRSFNLPPRYLYLYGMLRDTYPILSNQEICEICKSLWNSNDGVLITYDGQFPGEKSEKDLTKLLETFLNISRRIVLSRDYKLINESKNLLIYSMFCPPSRIRLKLIKKFNHWYKRDKFISYQLAWEYWRQNKNLKAVIVLYRALNDQDPFLIYSGKWIFIRLHLLLADVYKNLIKRQKNYIWEMHNKVEQEYKLATELADIKLPDMDVNDFEIVNSVYTDPKKAKKNIRKYLNELGFKKPLTPGIEVINLKIFAHHKYSNFLMKQVHREYDALAQESIVINEDPYYGEAYINCAMLCGKIGDAKRGLDYAIRAVDSYPRYMPEKAYKCMVIREKMSALLNLGRGRDAEEEYEKAMRVCISDAPGLDQIMPGIEEMGPGTPFWEGQIALSRIRRKLFFEKKLLYEEINSGLKLFLPFKWKIDKEQCTKESIPSVLHVIFSSPITWDNAQRLPLNASISVDFYRGKKLLEQSVEELGEKWINNFSASLRVEMDHSIKKDEKTCWGRFIEHDFSYKNRDDTKYIGKVVAIKTTDMAVLIHLMCLEAGRDLYWPIFTRFIHSVTEQIELNGID